jgi:hypothetical protein
MKVVKMVAMMDIEKDLTMVDQLASKMVAMMVAYLVVMKVV